MGKNKKINILFIVSIMPPYPGGASVDYGVFIKCLAEKFEASFDYIRVLTEAGCRKSSGRIEYHDVLYNYDSAETKSFFKQLVNYLIIILYILFTRKDVIHIHARYVYAKYIGRAVWLALLFSPSKVIIDIRDRFYANFGFGHDYIVCSEELLSFYSWIKRKEHIPVPLSFPPLKKIAPSRHIAYFGSISYNKGVMELIEGYKEYLKRPGTRMQLHFYGFNAIGERFNRAISGIDSIKYMGVAASEDIIPKILDYKAVILPSTSEGMPRICLETIYSGRIIACHKNIHKMLPCIPERFVMKDSSVAEFKRVLDNIESAEDGIAYDYDFNVHSPEKVCSALLGAYKRALSNNGERALQAERRSVSKTI